MPRSCYIREESLTAYSVPVSLKPGVYRVWVKAISVSGQVTGRSKSIGLTVVKADDDRKPFSDQIRNPASFLPSDLLIPAFGHEIAPVSGAAPEEITVVQTARDVRRILMSDDLPVARDVKPIPDINPERLAETDVLQEVTQAAFEATDWYSQL